MATRASGFWNTDPSDPLRIPLEDVLDLHTFAPREIPSVVEEYLEAAARAGFRKVRLIHGRGIGAQRAAVRRVCARHPSVSSFEDATPSGGGWGATVVTFLQWEVAEDGGPPEGPPGSGSRNGGA